MRKYILTIISLIIFTALFSQNNNMNYNKRWKIVKEYEKQSLPKSAYEEVSEILRMAIADKNSPQVIKSLIHQGKYDLHIDLENDTLIFHNLNDMLDNSSDVIEKSILNSLIGELYMQYYQKNSWIISQRTELGDFVPNDMKEWTRNIFYDKVVEHLNISIENQNVLENADITLYNPVIIEGYSSRKYFPTIYDFLSKRRVDNFKQLSSDKDLSSTLNKKRIKIESLFADTDDFLNIEFEPSTKDYNLWVLEAYKDHISSLMKREMSESILLLELQKLDYLNVLSSYYDTYAIKSLQTMLEKWENEPFSVEIVDKLTTLLQDKINKVDDSEELKNQKSKEIYDILKFYVAKYPKYDRIGILENKLKNITNPEYTVLGKNTFSIKGDKKLQMLYRNLSSLNLNLYKIGSPTDVLENRYDSRKHLQSNSKFIQNIKLNLDSTEEYLFNKYEFDISIDEPGVYMLSNDEYDNVNNSSYIFYVTDFAVFSRSSAKDKYDFFVVNRVTGEPIENASIDIYKLPGNWSNSKLVKEESIKTNSIGFANYKKDIPNYDVFYNVRIGEDNGSILNKLPGAYYVYDDTNTNRVSDVVNIFTDRAIYRPGQTVCFKAIATKVNGQEVELLTNKKIDLELRDANGREVSRETLSTNEFGSVSGEFILPTGVMNGMFYIYTPEGTVYFRVEEYKRPTFDIAFDKIDTTYSFGEELTVKGKAESFSGIILQDAEVSYTITRRQSYLRMWGGSSEHFAEGIVNTDSDGKFAISFTPEKSDDRSILNQIYSFTVEVSITDINGETQSSEYTISVGDISMILLLDVNDRLEKKSTEKINISATNLDGESIAAKGEYNIFSLHDNDSINKLVLTSSFEVGEQVQLKKELQSLTSGKYRVKLQSKDDKGREVTEEKDVIVFSYNDKKPPIKTNEWLVVKSNYLTTNKPAEVMFGVSEKVKVLYELWQENDLIERKWINFNNENRTFSFPYKSEYKDGVTLMLTYVKDEKFYTNSTNLLIEKENKNLNITLDVFRDKIRPSSKEEWRISVKDDMGNPTIAEVLASMYDLSLDKIYQTPSWRYTPIPYNGYISRMWLSSDGSFYNQQSSGRLSISFRDVKPFVFDSFNWFGYSMYSNYGGGLMVRSSARLNMPADMGAPAPKMQAEELLSKDFVESEVTVEDTIGMQGEEESSDVVRSNFDETAFFFPQLVTNEEDGELQFAFTVPDSNTKWKFRLMAHDKQLNTGCAEEITISQKEMMVTPNIPRFVRQGDITSISSKISNLSDESINGTVSIEFFNPVTDEVVSIDIEDNTNKSFTVDKGGSTQASWLFEVPSDLDLLGVRIVAQSETFSDGEQHALAVLPNRMLVTESMRMDVNRNEEKTFVFDRLVNDNSDSRKDYRLTLEFSSNPAWYAVQALPVLSTPDNANSVSWFASYYANKLGLHISKAYPKVAAMVDAWKKQGGTTETLISSLEKNEELKNVLLEETPWVMEANNESEQKQKLSLLFDLNRNQNITNKAIDKLAELQTYQGGWSWFHGFRHNVSITQYILYGFNQLKELDIDLEHKVSSMQSSAIEFIDREALFRFERMKKNNKNWKNAKSISSIDLEYVYVRSLYPNYDLDKEVAEMISFYTTIITNNWTKFNLYERSLIAKVMHNNGNNKVLRSIVKSYREHATNNEELGMYWANNRAQVFMSQSDISVHTFIMESFALADASLEEMDNMKRWLLKQKQTQLWESTHATLDAVYALLSTGSDWFSTEGETIITVGDKIVDISNKETGTGYIKESWSNLEIESKMGNVHISRSGNAPAWGAMYIQYFEDMDNITSNNTTLNVDKKLFVENIGESGKTLVEINDENQLEIGDKVVVRLVIRSDRDIDFVHVKDMRASCFEPINQVSGTKWDGRVIYYESPKDASTNYYFDTFPKGTHVFEYQVYVTRSGSYTNGITTIQSLYSPEFTSHTEGIRINVK